MMIRYQLILNCAILVLLISHLVNGRFNPRECGKTRLRTWNIINGRKSAPNQWPWLVNIRLRTEPDRVICGGSLISDGLVMTAAHCLYNDRGTKIRDPSDFWVYLGSHRLSQPTSRALRTAIRSYSIHPFYKGSFVNHSIYVKPWTYDIAILELFSRTITITKHAKPICLPCFSGNNFEPKPNERCIIAGWGITEDSRPSDVLLQGQVEIITRQECNRPRFWNSYVDSSMICAGDVKNPDNSLSCNGDSGGPLMCERDGRFYVSGVVNWGAFVCGNRPAVFANVAHIRPWLLGVLDDYGGSAYCMPAPPAVEAKKGSKKPWQKAVGKSIPPPCGASQFIMKPKLYFAGESTKNWEVKDVEDGDTCIFHCCLEEECKAVLYYPAIKRCFMFRTRVCDVRPTKVSENYSLSVVYYGKPCHPWESKNKTLVA